MSNASCVIRENQRESVCMCGLRIWVVDRCRGSYPSVCLCGKRTTYQTLKVPTLLRISCFFEETFLLTKLAAFVGVINIRILSHYSAEER